MKTLILALSLFALAFSVGAQEGALSAKLSEGGADWLLGEWTGTDPEGNTFSLTYGSVFDGQAGSVHFKSEGMEMKGLIAVDKYSNEVRQFGVTSTGDLATGTWDNDGEGPTLTLKWTSPDGSSMQQTYVYHWQDAKTARVMVYTGSRWGSNTTTQEVTIKRVP